MNFYRSRHDDGCFTYMIHFNFLTLWDRCLFWSPPIHHTGEGGIPPTKYEMAEHINPDTGLLRLTAGHCSHVLTALGRRTPHAKQGDTGLHSGAVWTSRLCGDKKMTWLLLSTGGCYWLVWVVLWTGREVKPIRLRTQWSRAGPADTGDLARRKAFPIGWGHIWLEQGNSWLSFCGPVKFNDVKAAHGIS